MRLFANNALAVDMFKLVALMGYTAALASDPIANSLSVAIVGNLRATFLTPSLVRLEVSKNQDQWDDRATLKVVNRYLPPVAYSRTQLNSSAVQLTTANLSVTYVESGTGTCYAQNGFHDNFLPRSPTWPNGTSASDVGACCAICQVDPFCGSYTFADGEGGVNCWLLIGSSTPAPQPNRSYGVPYVYSISVSFVGPTGELVTWTPGLVDPSNLNGTYTSLDCYSTPMECNSQYDAKMGSGLLSTAGWTALDDTAT